MGSLFVYFEIVVTTDFSIRSAEVDWSTNEMRAYKKKGIARLKLLFSFILFIFFLQPKSRIVVREGRTSTTPLLGAVLYIRCPECTRG